MSTALPPLALSMGDPAGIGPEIIARAWREAPELLAGCVVAGDIACMRRGAALAAGVQPPLPVAQIDTPQQAREVPPHCIALVQVTDDNAAPPALGHVSAAAGRMAAQCVRWAAQAALRGDVAALVTAPLNKEALAAAGEPFAGHTELLQAQAAAFVGKPVGELPVRMMLQNDELRTVLVSIHVPLRVAIEAVTFDAVLQTLRIAHTSLVAWLGRAPRMGVAGLNPHAGEGGLLGSEERDIIAPAVHAACREGIDARGPLAPDTVFMRARTGEFDVVVAMYHDQGLIPVKYLGLDHGVNATLGLPLVRTSPDHGTAFDIAARGGASAASLLAAIRVARQMARYPSATITG